MKSTFDRLNERIKRYPSESRFLLLRNWAYGSAAVCLVTLVQIVQVGAKDQALEVCVYACAIGMPLWVSVGGCYEFYILLGQKSYLHYRAAANFVTAIAVAASVALLTALGGAIYYLVPTAAYVFAAATGVAVIVGVVLHAHLARWWYGPQGPEGNERDV